MKKKNKENKENKELKRQINKENYCLFEIKFKNL